MTVAKSIALFVLAALAEIGGAWLIWQGWREHRGLWWIAGGIIALGAYGFVATFQPDPNLGRILAAYRGIFVAGSLAQGVLLDGFRPDGFRPDRYDLAGAVICLLGVGPIMYAPRGWTAAPGEEAQSMSDTTEANKAIVQRLVDEVLNGGNLDLIDQLYTPELAPTAHQWIASFRASLPDVHMDTVELIAEGDWSSAGSHAPPPTLAPGKDTHPQAGDSPTSPKSTSTASTTAKSPTPGPSRTTSSGLTQLGLLPNT